MLTRRDARQTDAANVGMQRAAARSWHDGGVDVRLYCKHVIDLDAEFFWAHIHAPVYEDLSAKEIGLAEYTEIERREDDGTIYRRIRVVPSIPEGLRSMLRLVPEGSPIGYIEEQWRSKSVREVRWKITPSVLAHRIDVEGAVRVEPIDAARCHRILDGRVRVRMPGAGPLIERAIVKNTIDAYAAHAKVAAQLRAMVGPKSPT